MAPPRCPGHLPRRGSRPGTASSRGADFPRDRPLAKMRVVTMPAPQPNFSSLSTCPFLMLTRRKPTIDNVHSAEDRYTPSSMWLFVWCHIGTSTTPATRGASGPVSTSVPTCCKAIGRTFLPSRHFPDAAVSPTLNAMGHGTGRVGEATGTEGELPNDAGSAAWHNCISPPGWHLPCSGIGMRYAS